MKGKNEYTVVGIGEILWDIYHEERYLGGAPANFAIHAAQLGDKGIVVSRIGNDGMGRELIRALEEKQVAANYLQIDKQKGTGTVLISLSVNGEPTFFCSEDVAFDYIRYVPELQVLAENADAVVFGSLAQRNEVTRKAIRQFLDNCKGIRIFDVNNRSGKSDLAEIAEASLQRTEILKANEQEIELLKHGFHREGDNSISFCRYLMDKFAIKLIALTRGREGAALILPDQEVVTQAGLPVPAIDSTGAGDAFTAGLVFEFLRGKRPQEILSFANLLGAYVCSQRGATPAINADILSSFARQFDPNMPYI